MVARYRYFPRSSQLGGGFSNKTSSPQASVPRDDQQHKYRASPYTLEAFTKKQISPALLQSR
jgi:hypothetical protein